jgi:hypothetical protein
MVSTWRKLQLTLLLTQLDLPLDFDLGFRFVQDHHPKGPFVRAASLSLHGIFTVHRRSRTDSIQS